MLTKEASREAAGEILGLMQKSAARMSALIDNVLDFARGRLGSGITLKRSPQSLEPVLNHVIAELRASSPERNIETVFDLTQPLYIASERHRHRKRRDSHSGRPSEIRLPAKFKKFLPGTGPGPLTP